MPLVYVFPYAIVFWGAMIWAYAPEFALMRRSRAGAEATDSPDAGSLRVILMGMSLASIAAFPIASIARLRFPAGFQLTAFWLGVGVLVAGSLLRRHCWRILGEHFTGDVRAQADQPVITAGAYGYVRHPSYTAGLLMNVGIGIALGSWASVALLAIVSVVVYIYRMNVEERTLAAALGEPYETFLRTRKRLIPYIY